MAKQSRWLMPEFDRSAADQLARALNVSPLAARVLQVRGYGDAEAARRFLCPAIEHLHDPFLLRDMEAAAVWLQRAIETKEKIGV